MSRAEAQLDRLIEDLHRGRPRVWSIIVSFFGDAISPRGGVLWLSTLRPLATRLGIESGTLGAALSRLTADGWLVREKRGRNTLYRLDGEGRAAFDDAAKRIYGTERPPWSGRWNLVFGPPDLPAPGYVRIDTHAWACPEPPSDPPAPKTRDDPRSVRFVATAATNPALLALVEQAWSLDDVARAYHRWLAQFSPLIPALEEAQPLAPLSAMCARLLLVHEFRRVVLKDPELPDELRRSDWPGFRARETAARLYRCVMPASEAWLNAPERTPDGPLPPPGASFFERFGGLK